MQCAACQRRQRARAARRSGPVNLISSWTTYEGVAEAYDALVERNGYAALARDLVAGLNLPQPATVLDVGCGTGAVAAALYSRMGETAFVVGVDLASSMVRCAAQHGAMIGVVGSALELPFGAGRFDAVTASLVLSHLEAYDRALAEMVRVARPGGYVGVTAWAGGGSTRSRPSEVWIGLAASWLVAADRAAIRSSTQSVITSRTEGSEPRFPRDGENAGVLSRCAGAIRSPEGER